MQAHTRGDVFMYCGSGSAHWGTYMHMFMYMYICSDWDSLGCITVTWSDIGSQERDWCPPVLVLWDEVALAPILCPFKLFTR